MTKRLEFTRKTKVARFAFCNGKCESCGVPLVAGKFEYDHDKEANDGGDNSFENCRCLCRECHVAKTAVYVKETRKAERIRDRHIGAMPETKRKIPGRGFAKKVRTPKPPLAPRQMYEEVE